MEDQTTIHELEKAYIQAANIVTQHGKLYLPIFERLEQELYKRKKESAILERARKVAFSAKIDVEK